MMRRLLVPEVVQTSAMDCGPASLKSLLEGHGVRVSYGRLREACQTSVDGTSIDTLEIAANELGLDASQVMAPVDHLPLSQTGLLPALVVVRHPNGATHFVVVWRVHGGWVQVMDPAVGRRLIPLRDFLRDIYVHTMPVPEETWREWAGGASFQRTLAARMGRLCVANGTRRSLLEQASSDSSFLGLARLDAAIRMVDSLTAGGAIRPGRKAAALLERLAAGDSPVPESYWTARPDPRNQANVLLSGAVMISVAGRKAATSQLSPELAAALREAPVNPARELLRLLGEHATLAAALPIGVIAAAGVALESLLLRGLFDLGRELPLSGQRLGGIGMVLAFFLGLLLLEWPLAASLLRLGRKLEGRLRIAFLRKIPLLGDRYFQSRLISDMAERSHGIHTVRALPELAGGLLRALFEMAFTVAAIAWLFPGSAIAALATALVTAVIPLAAQPSLAGRDLRWRTHTGALSRFYLDAMLGLVAIRAHGAERALRREQESMLGQWAKSGLDLQQAVVCAEGLQFAAGLGLAAWTLLSYLSAGAGADPAGVLLLTYWVLHLPMLGQEIGIAAWQYPGLRNTTLRLLEPLGAPEELPGDSVRSSPSTQTEPSGGVEILLDGATAVAGGHRLLDAISLKIEAGEHIAIVGPSGAGKSSLVGLLLGWHKAAEGEVLVDGKVLDASHLAELRRQTAWIDPQVQLWNSTLLENLQYGGDEGASGIERAVEQADLRRVLRKLPDGLQTLLGEGGALLSGGEGQRVRFGRALAKAGIRLVILDEPARGLDRDRRRALLSVARDNWPAATVLCVTHDVEDTLNFPRVLVVESARIVEDGRPLELAADPGSRYRSLLDAEHDVRRGIWSDGLWRRLRIENGQLNEERAARMADEGREATCAR